MKEIAVLLVILLGLLIIIGLKLKFYSFIFGEGGLLGPEDRSLSHEIKNLVKLRDQGLLDARKYEEMKAELLRRYHKKNRKSDGEIQKLEKLQKQGIITPEELDEMKNTLSSTAKN